MPSAGTVLRWVLDDTNGFRTRYRTVRDIGCELLADQVIVIADDSRNDWIMRRRKDGRAVAVVDHENIHRARLRCDTRQWRATKMRPAAFGDKPAVQARHQDDATDALAAVMKAIDGWSRGLPSADPPPLQLPSSKDDSDEPE